MRNGSWLICVLIVAVLPASASAQRRRDAIVTFKDEFYIKGIVNESVREVIWDKASGAQFPIFSGNFFLNDHVREIFFSPSQVIRVSQPTDTKPPMRVVRFDRVFQPRDIHSTWEFTNFGKWNEKGERTIEVKLPRGPMEMKQRVGIITPQYVMCATTDYKWNLMYFTEEFGPELSRRIVLQIFSEGKESKKWSDAKKHTEVAAFLQEAGWLNEAERELNAVVENYPEAKSSALERLAAIKKAQAELFIEGMEKGAKVGQHIRVIGGLDVSDREGYAKIVSPQHRLMAQDLRVKYDKLKSDLEAMRAFLKEMPSFTKEPRVWVKACEFINDELNLDVAGRLEEFLISAQQFDLERKNKRTHSLSAEKVLAIAISGWLQDSQAALPDAEAALKLVAAREFVLEYLKTDNGLKRSGLMSNFKRDNDLPMDVLTRLMRMIPPPFAAEKEKLTADVQTMTIELPDSEGGSYLLQLPPDYHHLRAYPVLVLLHSGRDKADETLKRFSEEAAKHGFILAAPLWAGNAVLKSRYTHSAREQAIVLDTLRDLRRRFQVDSDRVFLFGWEDGANMAFDVALGHPDQFAGVAPMNGTLLPFTRRYYWPNAQYVPFYVIGGERDGHSTMMRDFIKKDWTRDPYACMYVEYKGRASEWYGLEVAKVMNWMSRKKRFFPMKEMGRPNGGIRLGEEFHTSRPTNNRFYWLRGDGFSANTLNDHQGKTWPVNFRPATFQANLSVGNKSEKGEAKIWNQLNARITGVKQATFLISPGMMDLKHPLFITLNSQSYGPMRKIEPSLETMLDELALSGDRQRLIIAKVEMRP